MTSCYEHLANCRVIRFSLRSVALALSLLVFGSEGAVLQPETIVVRPAENQEVLVNPGMGITTFQRFNGQPLNVGVSWSEEGPTHKFSAPSSTTVPDFPGTSIAYCRWFWSDIEPTPGRILWEIIDDALAEARTHNQRLAIRLMPYDEQHPLPAWYRQSGAGRANRPADRDGAIWQPDFSDPRYLKYWGALVSAAGARYDGHPYLDSIDIASIGYWGEGWSDYMPPFSVQRSLTDIYLDAFRHTPLLMNIGQPQAVSYATARGAGWRLDCLGDMGGLWKGSSFSHMLDEYPQQIAGLSRQDLWQHTPVSLETCSVPAVWKQKGWDIDYILAQALRWHVTSLNVKSSPIPPDWKEKFDQFQKRMGYRFVLRRFAYRQTSRTGQMMRVQSWWFNAGVAPIYREYRLALQLKARDQSATIALPTDVRTWLPGDSVVDENVYIPDTLESGDYALRIALLDPRTNEPAIQLANEGREPDGWYRLGSISLRK